MVYVHRINNADVSVRMAVWCVRMAEWMAREAREAFALQYFAVYLRAL